MTQSPWEALCFAAGGTGAAPTEWSPYLHVKMRLPRTSARLAPVNLDMRNMLLINDDISRFMGRLGAGRIFSRSRSGILLWADL